MIKSALQSSLTNDIKYRSMSAGAVPSSEYLITSTILTQATPTITFDFTGLSGTYKHLQIVAAVKSTRTGGSAEMYGRANGLTQYWNHWLVGGGSSVGSGNFSYSKMFFGNAASSDTASDFAAFTIDLLDPFGTTKNKTVRTLSGLYSTQTQIRLASSIIPTTSPLTSFSFEIEPATNFTIGTRFSLYGVTA